MLRLQLLIGSCLIANLLSPGAVAEPVYVERGERSGVGYTFSEGELCFVVTAEHISRNVDEIVVIDTWRTQATAEVISRGSLIQGQADSAGAETASPTDEELRYDFLVAQLPASAGIACSTQWDKGTAADLRFREASQLDQPVLVERVNKDGSVRQKQARIAGTGRMTVRLKSDDNFLPGDSGSFLFYRGEGQAKHLVGMVVAVQGDQLTALTQSWLDSLIGPVVVKPSRTLARMSEPSAQVNLPMADYAFANTSDVTGCAQLCQKDDRCRAYSFVRPGVQSAAGVCWLKYQVPTAMRDPCCLSGIKQFESPSHEAAAARIQTDMTALEGIWRDIGYSTNFAQIKAAGDAFEFSRKGAFPNSGERFDVHGSGKMDRRAVTMSYEAVYSTNATSKGTCSGSLLEDPQRQLVLSMTCTDSRLGRFQSSSAKSEQ